MGVRGGGPEVRIATAAGTFYPGSAAALAEVVDRMLLDARRRAAEMSRGDGPRLRGVIVPHAGYRYSGPIAATAYALVGTTEVRPSRVVILGPSHSHPVEGVGLPSHAAWSTPLGTVPIDDEGREAALAAGATIDDAAHRREHSIEVQLPFIQRILPGVRVLPAAVGPGATSRGPSILDAVATVETLVVISTDLSHYHDADTARRLDARTAGAIETRAVGGLAPDDACGYECLRVGLEWARWHAIAVRLLDLRDSSRTAGDRDRVVGYGAFAMEAPGLDATRPSTHS